MEEKAEVVTKPQFLRSMGLAFKHLLTEHLSPLKARVKAVEERGATPADVATRLATVEARCGVLSMIMLRGQGGEKVAELEDLLRRIKDQEARIKTLEARPTVRYMGVWRDGTGHEAGAIVTLDGSMWHAQKTTTARPGTAPADWVLCAKGGKGVPR